MWSAPQPLDDRQAIQLTARYALPAAPSQLTLAVSLFPYDPAHQTFVNIYERDAVVLQAILSRDRQQVEFFPGTTQGTLAVIRRFAASGVHHILIGPDHLLFLIGLLLLGGSLRQLVLVVSAFTVAHSVTLSLAVFRVLAPPAWLIEPAIALSIVYVGADNLTVARRARHARLDRLRVRADSRVRLRQRAAGDGTAAAGARLVAVVVQPRRRGGGPSSWSWCRWRLGSR